mmetsp:Transcript_13195/g.23940  ORF Transcript_13195/g.23940 Transcript_13195/m.23940 type:complete len:91 (+) Transcript_13195:236-508(+)
MFIHFFTLRKYNSSETFLLLIFFFLINNVKNNGFLQQFRFRDTLFYISPTRFFMSSFPYSFDQVSLPNVAYFLDSSKALTEAWSRSTMPK